MSKQARRISRAHKLLGLVIGIQILFWTASGFYFTLFPIERIHGDHLRHEAPAPDFSDLGDIAAPQLTLPAAQLEIREVLGRPVWVARGDGWTGLYETTTGEQLSPLGEAAVRKIAEEAWAGQGEIVSVERIDNPPRETFSKKPLWRVQFDGKDKATFWVDAEEAKILAVRTGEWRLFDVLWRFHIMDVTGEDRFDTWWLKIAAFLGLTTVLFGLALLVQRALRGRLLK